MPQNTSKNNSVFMSGKVTSNIEFSHELYGEKFYEFNLDVPRLSGNNDSIQILVSERLINIENLKIDTMVNINGQIRSYNKKNNSKGNKLKLLIFAKDINVVENIPEDRNPNDISLDGFLCKEPVYRTTPFGREICDLIIAVNRTYNKSDYIPVITWGRNAKFCSTLQVGDNVKIWGRLQSREYDKKVS